MSFRYYLIFEHWNRLHEEEEEEDGNTMVVIVALICLDVLGVSGFILIYRGNNIPQWYS